MEFKKKDAIIGTALFLLAAAAAFYFFVQKETVKGGIEIYDIKKGQMITSPLSIKGEVTGGNWIGFEGQAGRVELIGQDGEKLGSAVLTATSDWTEFPVSFEASLSFNLPKEKDVFLVFYNENPSGMAEKNEVVSLPLKVSEDVIAVKAYFGKQGSNDTCTEVFPIERNIVKTEAVAGAAIEELIKGLSEEEKQAGYFTSVNQNTKVNKLTIAGGTARIDFDEALEQGVGGSCKVAFIRQQITQTLMQFSSVKKVIISIDGRTEDILQP